MSKDSLLKELQKRKVTKVAAIYVAVAWGATEIAVTIVEQLFLPKWISSVLVIAFVLGFPVAIFLAWTFDITEDGIQRTAVGSRRGHASIAASIVLLIAGTAGLFLLIRPDVEYREGRAGVVGIPPNSIAVLPFDNASRDSEDIYLSAGLSDQLRDQLGRMSDLRVAARSSSIAAANQGIDAKAAAEKLGVAVIVEGSVRRLGRNLQVSIQVIDGASGLSIWNFLDNRSPQELLYVQQEIAQQIVDQVLTGTGVTVAAVSTRNVNANELMLLARYYEQQVRDNPEVDEATLLEAIRLYREATEADPQSALAQSLLAGALLYLGDVNGAEAPIFKALALDPTLSEAQYTKGLFHWARGEPGALAAFRRAVELNPNSADALAAYAYSWWMQGYEIGPDELFRRALTLDPLSLSRYAAYGDFLGKNVRIDELNSLIARVQELFDGPQAARLIGDLVEFTGRIDETIAWTIRARDEEPGNQDHVERLADLYAHIGDYDTALILQPEPSVGLLFLMRRYEELIDIGELLMIEEPDDIQVRYLLAFAYNAVGSFELSVRLLHLTGLPDTVITETMRAIDIEAYYSLVNAVYGIGETATAHELATWMINRAHTENEDWWGPVYLACVYAVLEQDDETLAKLEIAKASRRLPWATLVQDSTCFQRLKNNAEYLAILDHLDRRRADIRNRLPSTLARFNVTL